MYTDHIIFSDGSGTNGTTSSDLAQNFINIIIGTSTGVVANNFGGGVVDISDYTSLSKSKLIRAVVGNDINGTVAGYGGYVGVSGGVFNSLNNITTLTIFPCTGTSFNQYSQFALYGIKGA